MKKHNSKDNDTGIKDSIKGDILVFCPNETWLTKLTDNYKKYNKEKVFFTSLSRATKPRDRNYIIASPEESYLLDHYVRRVVFSTPIVETGITIQGIKFVIETGLMQSVFYDGFTDRQIIKIDKVNQASSIQRCGRAGRTAPGVCIRLYTENFYKNKLEKNITPEIYKSKIHDLIIKMVYYTADLELALIYIKNLPDHISTKLISSAMDELYHHGIIANNTLSEKGISIHNMGINMEYSLLIIESFRYGIQNHIIPIVAMLLSAKNEGVRSVLDDSTSENRMMLYNTIKNPYGDIIAFLHIYELLSDTFIKSNVNLIESSHKKISYYISGEDNALTGSPMLYYDQLYMWCAEYGLNFYRMKDVITNVLEITKTVKDKIGHHKIYVETIKYNKISGGTDEMYKTINHIFSTCYYKNKAGYIPEIKKYILLESPTAKYANIPKRSFIQTDEPAKVIGYTDLVYVEMGKTLVPMFVCPFVIIDK